MDYRLLLDIEVVEQMQALPKRVRNSLLDHFQRIRAYPERYADYHERDGDGRRVEISIFGGFAIHYWIDSADKHVKILALRSADK